MSFSRREFLKASAGVAAGSLSGRSLAADEPVLTISADQGSPLFAIKEIAEQELGISLDIITGQYANRMQNAVLPTRPCQLFEFRSNNTRALWRSRAIKPLATARLSGWDELHQTLIEIEDLASGSATATFGQMPGAEVYLQDDDSLGSMRQTQATHMPIFFGNESFGYIPSDPANRQSSESWNWLISPDFRGKVALSNSPATDYYALALATRRAAETPLVADPSSPSTEELDELYESVMDVASADQFSAFWSDPSQLLAPFASREILLANLLAQDMPMMRGNGIDIRQATPDEGFLGQTKVLFLSSSVNEAEEEAAYRFMNWLMQGRAGVQFSRAGYSVTNRHSVKEFMSVNDWDYFYGGEPASEPIHDPSGNLVAEVGESRAGGSFEERFQNIGIWATTPIPNNEHILHHWQHLLLER